MVDAGEHAPLQPDGDRVRRGISVPHDPLISISILVVDEGERLLRCLDSIRATASGTIRHEVMVVANGAPPSTAIRLSERDDIVLIRSGVNLGFGGGHNWSARFARGAYLLFLNDDSTVEPGWMESLVNTADSHPGAGAVGSRVLYPDGRLQEAGGIIWRDGTSERIGRFLPAESVEFAAIRPVEYCSGCSLMVRRDAWESLAGFDPEYFPAYYEDADLCFRLRERGFEILYDPGSRIRHLEWGSTDPAWRTFLSERNRSRFLERWSGVLRNHEPAPPREDVDAAIFRSSRRLDLRPALLLVDLRSPTSLLSDGRGLDWVRRQAATMAVHIWLEDPESLSAPLRDLLGEHGVELLDGRSHPLSSVVGWGWDSIVDPWSSKGDASTGVDELAGLRAVH